jgi:molybdopterin molybdotransferase
MMVRLPLVVMISVEEATRLIKENIHLLQPVSLPVSSAGRHVLAEDVYARVSIPNFNQSAMDGYALKHDDYLKAKEFKIVGEIAAGDNKTVLLNTGEAIRIFTGAAVPASADSVVMQEKTEVNGNRLLVNDPDLKEGSNVRTTGTEIKEGELGLKKGTFLYPAAIGFLASIGVTDLLVYPKPKIQIIVTGNELKQPGVLLEYGQLYESNSITLESALRQVGITEINIHHVKDDLNEITSMITKALDQSDLVLISGGVSVGNYDFVVKAAENAGVRKLFHKVKQKPGKPLYAGVKGKKVLFGLPGNPASVLSCFYNYVIPAIQQLTGIKKIVERRSLSLKVPYTKKAGLCYFLKGSFDSEGVTLLEAQESFRLSSFAIANCLVKLPEEQTEFRRGQVVETLVLPYL